MKKIIAAAALAALMLLPAHRARAGGGASTFEMGTATGTTVELIRSSAGSLYAVSIDSAATAGDFIECFDSASANGFTAAAQNAGTTAAPKVAAVVEATAGTNQGEPAGTPVRILNNGLVCLQYTTTMRSRVFSGP